MIFFPLNILTERMGFLVKGKSSITFLTLLILSLILLILPVKMKKIISEGIFNFTYGPFYSLSNRIGELHQVYQNNRILVEKVTRLTLENTRLKEKGLENERLGRMLEFKSQSSFKLIPAEVVSSEQGRFPSSILINVGQKDGVKKSMTVINLDGVVGKVGEVLVGSSVVQLLLHPNCRVAAFDQRSRAQGIVKSKGGIILDLDNVPLDEDVKPGDEIYTSGLGEIFPAGLKVGRVTIVSRENNSVFKTVKIKPAVDFFSLEELFLIKP